MQLLRNLKHAFFYLSRGEFKELLYRLRVHFGPVDLRNTMRPDLQPSPDGTYTYRHSGGAQLQRVFDGLDIGPDDAIVDLGAGKGGALIEFAQYPFGKIAGVELLPELTEIARKNFGRRSWNGSTWWSAMLPTSPTSTAITTSTFTIPFPSPSWSR